jgi:hypothetical protein
MFSGVSRLSLEEWFLSAGSSVCPPFELSYASFQMYYVSFLPKFGSGYENNALDISGNAQMSGNGHRNVLVEHIVN